MKRRKPQPRCKCGHAKSRHTQLYSIKDRICTDCWDSCSGYMMDNLTTLERLSEYYETNTHS